MTVKIIAPLAATIIVASVIPGVALAQSAASAQMVQAEAETNLTRAFQSANAALAKLNGTPVVAAPVKTPKGVSVAAPPPPSQPAPKIDLAALPAALSTPVSIKWDGPLMGALKNIAGQIGYSVTQNGKLGPTTQVITLVENKVPFALVLQTIGAKISGYARITVNPKLKTISVTPHMAVGG